jgi:predicted lipase
MYKAIISSAIAATVQSQESNEVSNYAYSSAQALISRQLSADAYCGYSKYASHVFEGAAAGFVVTKTLYDAGTDTEGYVGYLASDNSIYVTFRGSSSIANWVTNFDATQAAYTKWPACNCKVHAGFQNAYNTVYATALAEVKRLKSLHSTYAVKTTGHSLGGALAHLTALALIADGIPTTMINFGQPRTGDATFATFSATKLTSFRVVHY